MAGRAASRTADDAVLVQTVSDVHSLEQALVENLHREDLNAWKKRLPFNSSSTSSTTPTSRSRRGWARAGRPSPTPCGSCSCRPACSARWPTAPSVAGHARALLGTPDRSFQEELAKRSWPRG